MLKEMLRQLRQTELQEPRFNPQKLDGQFILKWSKLEGGFHVHVKGGGKFRYIPGKMLGHQLMDFHIRHPRVRKFLVMGRRDFNRKPIMEYRVERADPPRRRSMKQQVAFSFSPQHNRHGKKEVKVEGGTLHIDWSFRRERTHWTAVCPVCNYRYGTDSYDGQTATDAVQGILSHMGSDHGVLSTLVGAGDIAVETVTQ
jgi:hypothetical protein